MIPKIGRHPFNQEILQRFEHTLNVGRVRIIFYLLSQIEGTMSVFKKATQNVTTGKFRPILPQIPKLWQKSPYAQQVNSPIIFVFVCFFSARAR